jgi:hypothetical protein
MGQLMSRSFDRIALRYRSSLALSSFHMLINALSIGHCGWRIILQRCCLLYGMGITVVELRAHRSARLAVGHIVVSFIHAIHDHGVIPVQERIIESLVGLAYYSVMVLTPVWDGNRGCRASCL